MNLKAIRERRAALGETIKGLAVLVEKENRNFTEEESAKWNAANAEYDELGKRAEVLARADGLDAESAKLKPDSFRSEGKQKQKLVRPTGEALEEARALCLSAWVTSGKNQELSRAQVKACRAMGFNPHNPNLTVNLPKPEKEQRVLAVGTATAGGNTVPQGFINNLERAMRAYDGVRAVANVMRTDSGNLMPWPTTNDTANVGVLVAENATLTDANADPTFGVVNFSAFKYSSQIIRVPTELIEDSAFDMANELGSMCGERIGVVQNTNFTTGTGTGQPQGIVTGAVAGVTAASATAIAVDDILNLQHSVSPAYRSDPTCAFMMHDSTLNVVRRLKDGQGRFMYEDPIDGQPPRLHGRPVAINMAMATTIAATAISILFGPMRYYKIRDVNQLTLLRLDERYAELGQVGFVALLRSDGRVLNAGTGPIRRLTH
jgi:HK97 family phage major capsid protein